MASLFSPITIRNVTIRNRIGVSPMCQYSSEDGFANDWHMAHIGARAAGGAGLIVMEASAVLPEGRITPADLGLWKDEHIPALKRVADFAKAQGSVIGIQLAHAGRKASMQKPWVGHAQLGQTEGGWQTWAPSPLPFQPEHVQPHEMSADDIATLVDAFVKSAQRAIDAGFQFIEIHAAHGYLLHEFLSPLTNKRQDNYGGNRENRFRIVLEIATALRKALPDNVILATRLSCIDWMDGGVTIEDSIALSAELKKCGVDLIDCSSGAIAPGEKIVTGPNYQLPFALAVKQGANIPVAAVGMITDAVQANDIIEKDQADFAFIARAWLKDPSWALHAAETLGVKADIPLQYERGYPKQK